MSFIIYPAIDLRDGKCVRLVQGDYNQETIYNNDPVAVSQQWQAQGAEWIHVVDLDGAKAGNPVNAELIGRMAGSVNIPIQVGGGLRTEADIERLLSLGVSRVILGTAAINNKAFVEQVLKTYGDRIAIGIDARDGYVAINGWLETSQVKADELAKQLADAGAKTFIYTDISRDGMMKGPNVEGIVQMAKACGQTVIASGGVSQYDDVTRLAAHEQDGVGGAIIGKALYTEHMRLEQVLQQLKG